MLVLSRKAGESIVIQDRIVVSILRVRGYRVWLGIDAPKEMAVHRQEILEIGTNEEYKTE